MLVIALIVLGPKRLPETARAVGKGMREMREALAGRDEDDEDEDDEDDFEREQHVLEPPKSAEPVQPSAPAAESSAPAAESARTSPPATG